MSPVVVHVTYQDAPVPGARVEWFRSMGGESPSVSGGTDGSGKAAMSLPPGRYFLVGQWRADGDYARPLAPGDRYAYFGGNPLYVTPASGGGVREVFVGLEEFSAPPPPAGQVQPGQGVSGVVYSGGGPLRDALVFAYLKPDSGFRDMGFAASAPTGAEGEFDLELPPGKYYLVVRKRAGGGAAGPLRKGDSFGYYPLNPVTVNEGGVTRATLRATTLRMRNAPAYSGEYVATASIEGRILDRAGRPVRGAYAALYDNPDLLNRPAFLSEVTGEDGRYRLPVPAAGKYFLGARSGYGGSPAPGDLYGRYEGTPDHSLQVRTGDRLTGFDIVVSEVQ